jgi:hypothetical protein
MDGAHAHLSADRPAAGHATLRALCVVVAPELSWHACCEPCGRRLGQYTRTMSDQAGPGNALQCGLSPWSALPAFRR